MDALRSEWLRTHTEVHGALIHVPPGAPPLAGTRFETAGLSIDPSEPDSVDRWLEASDAWATTALAARVDQFCAQLGLADHRREAVVRVATLRVCAAAMDADELREVAYEWARRIRAKRDDDELDVPRFEVVVDVLVRQHPVVDRPPLHAGFSDIQLLDAVAEAIVVAQTGGTDQLSARQARDDLIGEVVLRRCAGLRKAILQAAERLDPSWARLDFEQLDAALGRRVLTGRSVGGDRGQWEVHVRGEKSLARLEDLLALVGQEPLPNAEVGDTPATWGTARSWGSPQAFLDDVCETLGRVDQKARHVGGRARRTQEAIAADLGVEKETFLDALDLAGWSWAEIRDGAFPRRPKRQLRDFP
jgi:hypothetical protein